MVNYHEDGKQAIFDSVFRLSALLLLKQGLEIGEFDVFLTTLKL